jgi:hypothetical protein
MKLIARFIPMAFLLGACMYAQQPQDPQQQPTTPTQPSTQQPSTPAPSTAPSTPSSPSTDMPSSQQSTPTSQQPQTPNASENQPSTDQPKGDVTVTGKVVKSKGSLVIQDDASNSTYKVDNEDQLKQYMGKNVKVTGTLDAQTKTIHVTNIEVSAS